MINYPNGHEYTSSPTPLKQPKKSKYNAIKIEVNGIVFDSKKEAKRYKELKMLEQVGGISILRLQVPFELIPKSTYGRSIKYIADFVYNENGIEIVEDVKGCRTKEYLIKKRMIAEKYG